MVKRTAITRAGNAITEAGDASGIPNHLRDKAYELAKIEDIPIQGLTILGGKFYVNTTGLDSKIQGLEKKGITLKTSKADITKYATKEEMVAGAIGTIVLFDKQGFLEALKAIKEADKGTVEQLKEAFTMEFMDEGWASPADVSLPAIKASPGYLIMMASRRATNRAKRLATGCGLTSVEEMDMSDLTPEEKRKVEDEVINDAETAREVIIETAVEVVAETSSKVDELFEKIKASGVGGGKIKIWEAKMKGLPEDILIKQMEEELNGA